MKAFLIFLVFMLTYGGVQARTDGYYKTKVLCQGGLLERYQALGSLWMSAFDEAGLLATLADLRKSKNFKQLEVSREMTRIVGDPEHFEALRECFAGNQKDISLFFIGMLAADISGKFSSWFFDLTLLRLFSFSVRSLYATRGLSIQHRFMWLTVIMGLALRSPSVLRSVGDGAMFGALMASLYAEGTHQKLVHRQMALDQAEANDETVRYLLQSIQELRQELSQCSDERERAILIVLINQQQEAIAKIRREYKRLSFIS